jgi:hypothetical protein
VSATAGLSGHGGAAALLPTDLRQPPRRGPALRAAGRAARPLSEPARRHLPRRAAEVGLAGSAAFNAWPRATSTRTPSSTSSSASRVGRTLWP